jgi:hypothetical protein
MRSIAVALALLSMGVTGALAQEPERRCKESKAPGKLPAVGTLLDSARAVADLTAGEVPPGGLLFSLIYNDEDSLPQTRRLDSAATAAADLLAKSLRPQRPTEYWGVRVRVIGGAAPALTLERSRYCPALAASIQARPRRFVVAMRRGDRVRAVGTTVRFIADAEISETGQVWEIALLRPSGVREIDEEILRYVQIRPFRPALLDGTPVPSRLRVHGQTHKVWERLSDFGVQAAFSISMDL